jgi:hypothetical protein
VVIGDIYIEDIDAEQGQELGMRTARDSLGWLVEK